MRSRALKWYIGFATFAAVALVLPLFGYRRIDAAVLGLAFSLPTVFVVYAAQSGLYPRTNAQIRRDFIHHGVSGLLVKPLLVMALLLTGYRLLAVLFLVTMIFDARYLVIASRIPPDPPAQPSP